jgi:hypothetical protein
MKSKGAAIERVVPLHVDAAESMVAGWYWIALAFAVAVAACTRNREAPRAPFVPITVLTGKSVRPSHYSWKPSNGGSKRHR